MDKKDVIHDLEGALAMVGQAQLRLGDSKPDFSGPALLWTDLGKLFDEIEGLIEAVKEDAYD